MSDDANQGERNEQPQAEPAPLPKLTRASLAAKRAERVALQPVTVKELGGVVMFRPISAGRVREIERMYPTKADGSSADNFGVMRSLICDTIVDESREPIFTVDELRDGDDIGPVVFWSLWREVGRRLGMVPQESASPN